MSNCSNANKKMKESPSISALKSQDSSGASSPSSSSSTASNRFSSHSITIRAQKKIASKFATKKAMKFLIDDTTNRVFDAVYRMARIYLNSKTAAKKLMKDVIKINIKMVVLVVNDVLDEEEAYLSSQLRDRAHVICEMLLRVGRPHRQPVTMERLIQLIEEVETMVQKIIDRHLTEKTKNKVTNLRNFFTNRDFLEKIVSDDPEYKPIADQMKVDILDLMDRGVL